VKYLCSLLEQIGLQNERVKMVNLSAAMGARFAEVAAEVIDKIKELGPNPLGEDSVDPTHLAPEASIESETSYN
jgi:coenzyme F420-reducing hydrogenase delta subunit